MDCKEYAPQNNVAVHVNACQVGNMGDRRGWQGSERETEIGGENESKSKRWAAVSSGVGRKVSRGEKSLDGLAKGFGRLLPGTSKIVTILDELEVEYRKSRLGLLRECAGAAERSLSP